MSFDKSKACPGCALQNICTVGSDPRKDKDAAVECRATLESGYLALWATVSRTPPEEHPDRKVLPAAIAGLAYYAAVKNLGDVVEYPGSAAVDWVNEHRPPRPAS